MADPSDSPEVPGDPDPAPGSRPGPAPGSRPGQGPGSRSASGPGRVRGGSRRGLPAVGVDACWVASRGVTLALPPLSCPAPFWAVTGLEAGLAHALARSLVARDRPAVPPAAREATANGQSAGQPPSQDPVGDLLSRGQGSASSPPAAAGCPADSLPVGPGLAAWLSAQDLAGASDHDAVAMASAWRRVASWAQAGELAAVARVAARSAARDPDAGLGPGGRPALLTRDAAAQVSLELVLSRVGAEAWAGLALDLAWRLPGTAGALAAGRIDLVRARIVAEAVAPLSDEAARAVEARVLPGAGDWTYTQLRAAARRAVSSVDPDGAEHRRQAAERRAKVSLYADQDCTATLAGTRLPAAQAAAAMARVSAMARALKAAGAGGGLDLLRAQVYLGLLLGSLPLIPPPVGGPPDADPPDADPPDADPPDADPPEDGPPGDPRDDGYRPGGSPGGGSPRPAHGPPPGNGHDGGSPAAEPPGSSRDAGSSPGDGHDGTKPPGGPGDDSEPSGSDSGGNPPGGSPDDAAPPDSDRVPPPRDHGVRPADSERPPAGGQPPTGRRDPPPASADRSPPPHGGDAGPPDTGPPGTGPPGADLPPAGPWTDAPPLTDADLPRDEGWRDMPLPVPNGYADWDPDRGDPADHELYADPGIIWPWPGAPVSVGPGPAASGPAPPGAPGPPPPSAARADSGPAGGGRPPPGGLIDLTLPWATLTGTADAPGTLGRIGPITAPQARALARMGTINHATQWRVILTDPDSTAIAVARVPRPRIGTRPGEPAAGAPRAGEIPAGPAPTIGRVTVIMPAAALDAAAPDGAAPDGAAPDRTAPDRAGPGGTALPAAALDGTAPGRAAPDHAAIDKSQPGNRQPDSDPAASGDPLFPSGMAVPADLARACTQVTAAARRAHATARRQADADQHAPGGCAHLAASPAYRPPPRLREHVTARDQTCRNPRCGQPAWRADLDHTRPHHLGGLTCSCNLGGFCRGDHQLKQLPGWTVTQPRPGTFTWTSPAGRTYTTRPDPHHAS